jgi:hypothetical protein
MAEIKTWKQWECEPDFRRQEFVIKILFEDGSRGEVRLPSFALPDLVERIQHAFGGSEGARRHENEEEE